MTKQIDMNLPFCGAEKHESVSASNSTDVLAMPIDIKDGTTLLISGGIEHEILNELSRRLRLKGLRDVLIICLDPGQTIDTLDDAEMERFGWVRKAG